MNLSNETGAGVSLGVAQVWGPNRTLAFKRCPKLLLCDKLRRIVFSMNPETRRNLAYWVTTALLEFELVLGGVWDVLRVHHVRSVVDTLGYPEYSLVILGVWKLLGSVALVIP